MQVKLVSKNKKRAVPFNNKKEKETGKPDKRKRLSQQLSNFLVTITVLTKLIEMKDSYTQDHSKKMSMCSEIIARKLELNYCYISVQER